MRILCTIALFLLLSFEKTQAQITITGQIKYAPDSVEVSVTYYNNPIESLEIIIGSSDLDENGYFYIKSDLSDKMIVKFRVGIYSHELFITPGDSINISTEYYEYDKKINIYSSYKAENDYLISSSFNSFRKRMRSRKSFKNPFVYKAQLDSVEKINIDYFNKCSLEFKDDYFTKIKRSEIKYHYIFQAYLISIDLSREEIPTKYYSFLDSIDLNLPKKYWIQEYLQSVEAYLYVKCNLAIPNINRYETLKITEKEQIEYSVYNFIKSKFKGDIKDYLLSNNVKYDLNDFKSDTAFQHKIIRDYMLTCNNKDYKKHVKDFYFKRNNLNNKIIPNFELLNIYDEKVNIHSFKGKYIYIDFWATWCYPCLVYLKDYPSLQERYKNRNDITYLFINILDKKSNWSNYVLNKPTYGINLFANSTMSNSISKHFDMESVPRYMIIDKNLKIIDVDAEIPKNVILP